MVEAPSEAPGAQHALDDMLDQLVANMKSADLIVYSNVGHAPRWEDPPVSVPTRRRSSKTAESAGGL